MQKSIYHDETLIYCCFANDIIPAGNHLVTIGRLYRSHLHAGHHITCSISTHAIVPCKKILYSGLATRDYSRYRRRLLNVIYIKSLRVEVAAAPMHLFPAWPWPPACGGLKAHHNSLMISMSLRDKALALIETVLYSNALVCRPMQASDQGYAEYFYKRRKQRTNQHIEHD